MIGEWIKMRPTLLTSPRVSGIARILESDREVSRALTTGFSGHMDEIVTRNVMRYVTVTGLLCVWGAANEHTEDGVFHSADLSDLDDMAGIPGFGAAMEAVGWAVYDPENDTVTLPNFYEYNTPGKERTKESAAERQRRYRASQKAKKEAEKAAACDVTGDVTGDVTNNDREEERREEISPSLRSGDKAPRSRAAAIPKPKDVDQQTWDDFLAHRKAKGAALTATALAGIEREAEKAGWSLQDAIAECCTRGWQGFKADWVADKPTPARSQGQALSFAERDELARRQRWQEMTGRPWSDSTPPNVIDIPATVTLEIER